MLTVLILVCSLASVSDLGACTEDNALQVIRDPEAFVSPVACFVRGQATWLIRRSDVILAKAKPSKWFAREATSPPGRHQPLRVAPPCSHGNYYTVEVA